MCIFHCTDFLGLRWVQSERSTLFCFIILENSTQSLENQSNTTPKLFSLNFKKNDFNYFLHLFFWYQKIFSIISAVKGTQIGIKVELFAIAIERSRAKFKGEDEKMTENIYAKLKAKYLDVRGRLL